MKSKKRKVYYKVLKDGRSCNGGDLKWSLPKRRGNAWVPGDWHKIDGEVVILCCISGLHLTTKPRKWMDHNRGPHGYDAGLQVYVAQGRGHRDSTRHTSDKTAFREARLLRRIPRREWKNLPKRR